jgi:endonuclease YncB( thermonuclease family)
MANTNTVKGRRMKKITNLRIKGHVEVSQFWPEGDSDADTTKILITVGNGSFLVKVPGAAAHVPTRAYERAYMRGDKKPDGTFKQDKLINAKNQITVRLQRVDAPELHISPGPIKGKSLKGTGLFKKYRQRQSETGTNALRMFLKGLAGNDGKVPCVFDTNLDASKGPGEAVDKYGRFVGDILVGKPGQEINLNLWLLEQGWCIVALYESMLPDEIEQTLKAWRKGKGKGSRKMYRAKFEPFEELEYRKPGSPVENEGTAKFIHPKYFRRYVTWFAHNSAGNFDGDYADFMLSKAEEVYDLHEFLDAVNAGEKAPLYPLYDADFDGDRVGWEPEQFIFLEAPSTVYVEKNGVESKLTKADW